MWNIGEIFSLKEWPGEGLELSLKKLFQNDAKPFRETEGRKCGFADNLSCLSIANVQIKKPYITWTLAICRQ
jgi:hypothetical protein